MPLTYPKRDGFLSSLTSVEVLEGATIWAGLTSIGWTATVEGGDLVYANKMMPYGHLRGQGSPKCELTFLAESYFDWLKNNPGPLVRIFPSVMLKNQEGSRVDMIKIVSARFTEADGPSEGTDANEVTKPANALDIFIKPDGAAAYTSVFTGLQDGEAAA